MDMDRIRGTAQQVGGKLRDVAGQVTGDRGMRAEGIVDEVAGGVRNLYGQAKDGLRDAADTAADHVGRTSGGGRPSLGPDCPGDRAPGRGPSAGGPLGRRHGGIPRRRAAPHAPLTDGRRRGGSPMAEVPDVARRRSEGVPSRLIRPPNRSELALLCWLDKEPRPVVIGPIGQCVKRGMVQARLQACRRRWRPEDDRDLLRDEPGTASPFDTGRQHRARPGWSIGRKSCRDGGFSTFEALDVGLRPSASPESDIMTASKGVRNTRSEIARAAAARARALRLAEGVPAPESSAPHLFIVRVAETGSACGWEIRRFGAIVLVKGETVYPDPAAAATGRRAGAARLAGRRGPAGLPLCRRRGRVTRTRTAWRVPRRRRAGPAPAPAPGRRSAGPGRGRGSIPARRPGAPAAMRRTSDRTSNCRCRSSARVGSSRSGMSALRARVWAMKTSWRWPPLSCARLRNARSSISRSRSTASTRCSSGSVTAQDRPCFRASSTDS